MTLIDGRTARSVTQISVTTQISQDCLDSGHPAAATDGEKYRRGYDAAECRTVDVVDELDIGRALSTELRTPNRLLPPRLDQLALRERTGKLEKQIRALASRSDGWGTRADIVLADKLRGARPLSVLTLADRVLYRALVDRLSTSLPRHIAVRESFTHFRDASVELHDARYVTTLDVSSYFVYVDHELLTDELISQTGDIAATDRLAELLQRVMGRRVGLPQISTASDVLGDSYLDRVYRRLTRRGYLVTRFADDFRIFSDTLEDARKAVESCAMELHALGLVLNTDKTFTYGAERYRESLNELANAEQKLFEGGGNDDEIATWLASTGPYRDSELEDATDSEGGRTLASHPLTDIDEADATQVDPGEGEISDGLSGAARRAWEVWTRSSASGDHRERAIARTLVARALPILGKIDDRRPLATLHQLMSSEPALTPDVAAYLAALPAVGGVSMTRRSLDRLLGDAPPLSTWQKIWIADAAGRRVLRSRSGPRPNRGYEKWLIQSLTDPSDGLAATAAASLGRLGVRVPDQLAKTVDRVGPPWRPLALWGLAELDVDRAREIADGKLARLVLGDE